MKKGEVIAIKFGGIKNRLGIEYYDGMKGRVVGFQGDLVVVDILERKEWLKSLRAVRYKTTNVLVPRWAITIDAKEVMEVE